MLSSCAGQEPSCWRSASTVTVVAMTMAFTACHYVDPQCLAPGFGIGARREHGVLFQLNLNLPLKRYTETISLFVDGSGGVQYSEASGDISTCRRLSDEEKEGLSSVWSGEALLESLPQCGPGYAYSHYAADGSCRASRRELSDRRLAFSLSHAEVLYNTEDRSVSFSWDLESALPEELEGAFTNTLGLLCGGSSRLGRNLRRSVPELAERAGC